MAKYYSIPFFKVGDSAPTLLLMLDEHYEKSDWFRQSEPMPIRPLFDDETSK